MNPVRSRPCLPAGRLTGLRVITIVLIKVVTTLLTYINDCVAATSYGMKSKSQKKKELATLEDSLSKSKITIFTSFARRGEKGLNVADMRKLKQDLRSVDSQYLVEKKTLLNKALSENKMKTDIFGFPGSMGVVFGYGDETVIAKSVYTFAKKNPAFKYFGAFMSGKFMDLKEFTEFAKLPSREVLLARLFGMMKYPLSSFVGVLSQIAKKNETAGVAN